MFLLIVGMEKGYKAQTSILDWATCGIRRDEKLWLPYRGYWDTMLIPFPIIVLWQYATIMKPISILPTHRYIRSSRLRTYFVENGFKDNFYGIVPTQLIPALLTDSRVETLLKAGRTDHLRYFLGNKRTFEELWQSYKIAVRKGYDITDISLWSDYVRYT